MNKCKSFSAVFFLILLLLSACADPQYKENIISLEGQEGVTEIPPAVSSSDIVLAPGDTVAISVWEQDALAKEVTIDATGYIRYPLAGKIKAAGLSNEQLADQVAIQLRRYFTDPQVTVMSSELAGQSYYILGEVNNPGKDTIKEQIVVMDAIAAAGGLSVDAADIVILLRKQSNRLLIYSIPLTYSDLSENHLASITTVLQPKDILYVPASHIANVERFMQRLSTILSPLLDLERSILYWPELINALEGSSSDVLVK